MSILWSKAAIIASKRLKNFFVYMPSPLEYNLSLGLDLVLYSLLYPQCFEQSLLTHSKHLLNI